MSTVEDIARNAIALAGSDMGVRLAGNWVNRRWKELVAGKRLKHLRRIRQLFLPARINAGTVTATRGSTIVTGDATAQAAWSEAIVGREFRGRVTWYRIAQFQTTQIVLESEFAEDTLTAGSYDIVQRFHNLPIEVKHLGSPMNLMRLHRPVWLISLDRLNSMRAGRPTFGPPIWVAEVGLDLTRRVRRVEVYPYPEDDSETLHYMYWEDPPDLEFRDKIPGFINTYALEEGVLVDVLRQMGLQANRDGEFDKAVTLLNESRRQDSLWRNDKKKEATLDEAAYDDAEVILEAFQFQSGSFNEFGFEIATAFDQVWSR